LLLAAGTATDTNGGANYTAQFAINGQRGAEATFAMDGADSSDPELGGATFTNFNVDAVQEIQSSSGWMACEIGRGGAGYTNIVTRSGTDGVHGSVFEFLRNSALDARNYFDHSSPVSQAGFRRSGAMNSASQWWSGFPATTYMTGEKTYYFGEYQGFRQVLGTTQVFPVPRPKSVQASTQLRIGDTLIVPWMLEWPKSSHDILCRTTRKAHTAFTPTPPPRMWSRNADQFSVRMDHQWGANHVFWPRIV